jgi:hypothetical protein
MAQESHDRYPTRVYRDSPRGGGGGSLAWPVVKLYSWTGWWFAVFTGIGTLQTLAQVRHHTSPASRARLDDPSHVTMIRH